jgi:two-component system, OmpR family, response regulator
MRALIIEDDLDTQDFLKSRLEEKCFAVDTVDDGDRALYLANTNEYDIILLDYSLPHKNGYEICDELRKNEKHVPIIMISVKIEIPHKVEGFNIGIDDYMTKPFYFDELYARIQAVLRRPKVQHKAILNIDDLSLDTTKQQVRRGRESIYLTRKEFSLLEYLLLHSGSVVSRGAIMEHIWDINLDPFSNTIETHILNLRKKIDTPPRKKLIHSVPGRGYKIDTVK